MYEDAESVVSDAIAGRREEVFLVSKVVPSNASARGAVAACERSLARLRTDRLDCYLLHWPGPHPLHDTFAAFERLREQGKILSWGVSNFDVPDLEVAWKAGGKGRIACNQVLYNLQERSIEHAVLPWCEEHGVAMVAYSPFGHGSFPSARSSGGGVTPRVAKHRFFIWMDKMILPDSRLVTIARDDDVTFGIVHSRFHELWSLRLGGWHSVGNDPQHTPSLGFETYPFPEGLNPDDPRTEFAEKPSAKAIAAAARSLNELREAWSNPPELMKRVAEVAVGFPKRLVPVDDEAAQLLKVRTLTKLYNLRPAWLANAHKALDDAVAAAYGWPFRHYGRGCVGSTSFA